MMHISHCAVLSGALFDKEPVNREKRNRVKTQGRGGWFRDLCSDFHGKAFKTKVTFIYCRTSVLFCLMALLLFFSLTGECACECSCEYENDHRIITKAAIVAVEYTNQFTRDKRFDRGLHNAGLPDHVFASNNNFHRALKSAGMDAVSVAAEGSVLSVFYLDTTGHYITKIGSLLNTNYKLKKKYPGDWPMQYDVYRKCPGETDDTPLSEANQVASFCFFWHLNEEILIPVIENRVASFIKVEDESGHFEEGVYLDTFSVFGYMVLDNYYLQILFSQGGELLDFLNSKAGGHSSAINKPFYEQTRSKVDCLIGKHNFLSERLSKVYQCYKRKYRTNRGIYQCWVLENKRVEQILGNMGNYIKSQGNILRELSRFCNLDTLPMGASPGHGSVERNMIAATAGDHGISRIARGNEKTVVKKDEETSQDRHGDNGNVQQGKKQTIAQEKTPEKESTSAASEKMQGEYPDTLLFPMESACAGGDDGDELKQDIGADRVEDITEKLGHLLIAEETRAQQNKQDETMDEAMDEDEARDESRKKHVAARPSALVPMTVAKAERAMPWAGDEKGALNASTAVDLAGSYTELFIKPEKKEQRILLNKKHGLDCSGKNRRAITGSFVSSKFSSNGEPHRARYQGKSKKRKKNCGFSKNENKQSPSCYTLSLNSLCDDDLSEKDSHNKIKELINSMSKALVADAGVLVSQPSFSFDASARVKEINEKKERRNKKRYQAATGSAVFMSGLYRILSKRKFWYVTIPVITAIGIATDIPDLGLEFLYKAYLASLALFYDSDEELMSVLLSYVLIFAPLVLTIVNPLYNTGYLFYYRNQLKLSREEKKLAYRDFYGKFALGLLISPLGIMGYNHLNKRNERALVPNALSVYSNDPLFCSTVEGSAVCYYDREFVRYKSDYPKSKVDEWYSQIVSIEEEVKELVNKGIGKDEGVIFLREIYDIAGVCGLIEDDKLDRLCIRTAFYMGSELYMRNSFRIASLVEKYKNKRHPFCFREKEKKGKVKKRGSCFLLKLQKVKSDPIKHVYIDSIPCIITEDGIVNCAKKTSRKLSSAKKFEIMVPQEVKGDFYMLCYNGLSKGWDVLVRYSAETLRKLRDLRKESGMIMEEETVGRLIRLYEPLDGGFYCAAIPNNVQGKTGLVFYFYEGERKMEFLLNN